MTTPTEPTVAWKPILSGPKDGSDVLLFLPSGRIRVGFFSSTGEWQNSASFNKVTPTHWMALPAPPKNPVVKESEK